MWGKYGYWFSVNVGGWSWTHSDGNNIEKKKTAWFYFCGKLQCPSTIWSSWLVSVKTIVVSKTEDCSGSYFVTLVSIPMLLENRGFASREIDQGRERERERETPTRCTKLAFIISCLSQHVSGIIMPETCWYLSLPCLHDARSQEPKKRNRLLYNVLSVYLVVFAVCLVIYRTFCWLDEHTCRRVNKIERYPSLA